VRVPGRSSNANTAVCAVRIDTVPEAPRTAEVVAVPADCENSTEAEALAITGAASAATAAARERALVFMGARIHLASPDSDNHVPADEAQSRRTQTRPVIWM
jgi:hypothetical protein